VLGKLIAGVDRIAVDAGATRALRSQVGSCSERAPVAVGTAVDAVPGHAALFERAEVASLVQPPSN